MKNTKIEFFLGIGIFIFVCIIIIKWLPYYNDKKQNRFYKLSAEFNNVNGLSEGSFVRVNGFIIGYVGSILLDPKTMKPTLCIHINRKYDIPKYSIIEIVSENLLLGTRSLRIIPSGKAANMEERELFHYAHSGIDVNKVLGMLLKKIS